VHLMWQGFELFSTKFFWEWNLVEKILYPAKWTKKSADKPAQPAPITAIFGR